MGQYKTIWIPEEGDYVFVRTAYLMVEGKQVRFGNFVARLESTVDARAMVSEDYEVEGYVGDRGISFYTEDIKEPPKNRSPEDSFKESMSRLNLLITEFTKQRDEDKQENERMEYERLKKIYG